LEQSNHGAILNFIISLLVHAIDERGHEEGGTRETLAVCA
jgi:hypothetical protein